MEISIGIFFLYFTYMNYLGHLFFSNNDLELMYANMYGDFIKGSNLSHHPEIVQKGIKLHRQIDSYIDNHEKVLELKRTLSDKLPKVSGIAIDLYFDHLLAINWNNYRTESLEKFTNEFYKFDFNPSIYSDDNFQFLIEKIKADNWLYHYQYSHGLEFACRGLSKRISFKNDLWKAPEIFTTFREEIDETFIDFMQDAIPHFKEYHLQISM